MPEVISGFQIETVLREHGVEPFNQIILDSRYVMTTADYIKGQFTDDMKHNLFVLGRSAYKPQANDCDDFAIEAWALARRANPADDSALAFGWLSYEVGGSGDRHLINFWIGKGEKGWTLNFYEPQIGRMVLLTDDEKTSVRDLVI